MTLEVVFDRIIDMKMENGNYAFAFLKIDCKKALDIVSLVFLGLGFLFLIMGIGFYLGFAAPESRDLRLAQNENIMPISAKVVRAERTASNVNGETMYRIVFEWSDRTGKSNAVYSSIEAENMVGKTIQIRAEGNRAVMVNYERSVLSLLGFIFIGVFGGLGVVFISTFIVVYTINKKQNHGRD